MPDAAKLLLCAVVLALGALLLRGPATRPAPVVQAADFAAPTDASRRRGLTWSGVAPADRQAVLDAIGRARPEARRLIAAVAGLVTVRVGPSARGTSGQTRMAASGYEVTLDLALAGRLGRRGIDRLVLHELGHVVDGALVDDELLARLDAQIPVGYGCDEGVSGGCAVPEERFAESFAKWAMDDIGLELQIGYRVMPPSVPLAVWGAPLAALAAPA